MSLDLPDGGQPDRALKKEDIRTVEVDKAGAYMLDGETMTSIRLNKNWLTIIETTRIFWCTSVPITRAATVP